MSISDVKAKKHTVFLDKEREIIYDLNAFAEVEEKLGITFQEAMKQFQNVSVKVLRTFLWAGLIHEDNQLTEKEVGKMVTMKNFQYVLEAIANAISDAMPEEEESEEKN